MGKPGNSSAEKESRLSRGGGLRNLPGRVLRERPQQVGCKGGLLRGRPVPLGHGVRWKRSPPLPVHHRGDPAGAGRVRDVVRSSLRAVHVRGIVAGERRLKKRGFKGVW